MDRNSVRKTYVRDRVVLSDPEKELNQEEYKKLEIIAHFHPAISQSNPEKHVAQLYSSGIYLDMYNTALKGKELAGNVNHGRKNLEEVIKAEQEFMQKYRREL